jgi:hypothetical protein
MKPGQAALKNSKYKYEDVLTFLVPHLGEREGLSNVPKPQGDEEDEHESVDDMREDFTEETCQQRPVDKEPITEDENIPVLLGIIVFGQLHCLQVKSLGLRQVCQTESTQTEDPTS